MKKICLIILISIVSTMRVFSQPDPNFHIYIAFGQSNMEGQGLLSQDDLTDVSPRLLTLSASDYPWRNRSKGEWYMAVPPLCREDLVTVDPTTRGLGPCDFFGRTMVENTPDSIRIGIICVAVGASAIEGFMKDKSLTQNFYNNVCWDWLREKFYMYDYYAYQHIVNLAQRAQQDGVIKGILIHQGESNYGQTDWPTKVRGIYMNMLSDLGLQSSDVPLVVGEVVEKGPSVAMNDIIRTIPSVIPNGHVVSSSGIPEQPGDEIHFSPEGYREIGRRYAHTFLTLEGYTHTDADGTWHESLEPILNQAKNVLEHSTSASDDREQLSSAIQNAMDGIIDKSALKQELHSYYTSGAQPEAGYPFDMTYLASKSPSSWEGSTAPYYYLRSGLAPEFYAWDTNKQGVIMHQELEGIPNGCYSVVLEAASSFTSGRGFTSPITDEGGEDRTYVYANHVRNMVPVVDMGNNLVYEAHTYVLNDVEVNDNTLDMGLVRDRVGANWDVIQIKRIWMSAKGDNSYMKEELKAVERTASLYSKSHTLPSALISQLTSTSNDDTELTNERCIEEINRLEDVIMKASAASRSYRSFLKVMSDIEKVLNVSHYVEHIEGAHEAFENALQQAYQSANEATEASEVDIQTAALRQALYTYISNASPAEGYTFNLTCMLTNPDLTPFLSWQKVDGWYTDQTSGNSNTMSNNTVISADGLVCFYEYWNPTAPTSGFTAYQQLLLPAGNYQSKALAFARDASSSKNVFFNAGETEGSKISSEVLADASVTFSLSEEQQLKIGLISEQSNTATWMGIGYMSLYKLPDTPSSIDAVSSDIQNSPEHGVFTLQGSLFGMASNSDKACDLLKEHGQNVCIWKGKKYLVK